MFKEGEECHSAFYFLILLVIVLAMFFFFYTHCNKISTNVKMRLEHQNWESEETHHVLLLPIINIVKWDLLSTSAYLYEIFDQA